MPAFKYQNHDSLFKSLMSNVDIARDFFQRHLPNKIKKIIDFEKLEPCKQSYIDPKLKNSEVDVLYKSSFDGHDGYIYILCEHQSTVDKNLAFRIMKYIFSIMDGHFKKHKALPIVFPMVFYTGKKTYNATVDFFDLFGCHKDLARETLFKPLNLVDLTQVDDEELMESVLSGTFEFIFKHIHSEDIVAHLRKIRKQLKEFELATEHSENLTPLIHYVIVEGSIKAENELVDFIEETFADEKGKKMATTAQLFWQRGVKEGKQEGLQKGLQNGIQKVALSMLRKRMSIKTISEVTGLSEIEINKLKTAKMAS